MIKIYKCYLTGQAGDVNFNRTLQILSRYGPTLILMAGFVYLMKVKY